MMHFEGVTPEEPSAKPLRTIGLVLGLLIIGVLLAGGLYFLRSSGDGLQLESEADLPQVASGEVTFSSTYEELVARAKIPEAQRVLVVSMDYDADRSSAFGVTGVRLLENGYANSALTGDDYSLMLVDENGAVLSQASVSVPFELIHPPPHPGFEDDDELSDPKTEVQEEPQGIEPEQGSVSTEETSIQRVFNFAGVVDWHETAREVQLLNPQGLVAARYSIPMPLPVESNQPSFKALRGEDLVDKPHEPVSKLPNWLARLIPTADAFSDNGELDIAIIGDDYTADQLSLFQSHAATIPPVFLAAAPFSYYTDKINFYAVDNTVDLNCFNISGSRSIICDNNAVINQVVAAGVPYDKIHVLWNTSLYSGSTSIGAVVSAGYAGGSWREEVVRHELAHTLRLHDEYLARSFTGGTQSINYSRNCFTGTPPEPVWEMLGPTNYFLECRHPDWYRSSSDSIMRSVASNTFNLVSRYFLRQEMALYIDGVNPLPPDAAGGDAEAPTVSLTAPVDGASVSGTIALTATASDNIGVSQVQFLVDGSVVGTDTTTPYTSSWDTSALVVGNTYVVTAKASDAAGNETTSSAVTVTIVAPADTQAPTVSLTSPTDGTNVSGTVSIAASASDNVGVTQVQFLIDGSIVSTDTAAPYTYDWDTSALTIGTSYTLTAKAFDAAGNEATSSGATVTIVAPPDTQAPGVAITSPSDGADVSGVVGVAATASDNIGVTQVEFIVGGSVVSTDTTEPYMFNWNTSAITPNTQVVLTATASDAAGNETTSSAVTVTIVAPADTQAPTVSLTSPTDGSDVSDTVTLSATASDNIGVTQVEFFADGSSLGVDTTSPYTFNWDTLGIVAGTQVVLTVTASDAAGNQTTSSDTTVTVTTPADTQAPTVSLTSPTDGTNVSGTVSIAASASDNVGVTQVQFLIDGSIVSTDTAAPYTYDWDTSALTIGTSYTLTAKAFDAAGNEATSAAVAATIVALAEVDLEAPVVAITQPTNGTELPLSGDVTIDTLATDNVGVVTVDIDVDGAVLESCSNTGVCSATWNVDDLADGSYVITVTATDAAGNIGVAMSTVVKVTPTDEDEEDDREDPIVTPEPSREDRGGGDSGGGGGGSGGGGGGGDSGGGGEEESGPKRGFVYQSERGWKVTGQHSGVQGNVVKLASSQDVISRTLQVPADDYWVFLKAKDDRPGPVKAAVYVAGPGQSLRAWKIITLGTGDDTYKVYRLGRLSRSDFPDGVIQVAVRFLNDSYDRAAATNEALDRNLWVDWVALSTETSLSGVRLVDRSAATAAVGGGSTGGRSGGWTVLPRVNAIMREEGIPVTVDVHTYYLWRLTVSPGHRASIQNEATLRTVMRYWRGVNPARPRGEIVP